jgi:hypothetical protein
VCRVPEHGLPARSRKKRRIGTEKSMDFILEFASLQEKK